MENLADLFADEETVLRGYIAVKGVRVMGHKYMGTDKTVAISFAKGMDIPEEEEVLWCYVEKERGKAPLLFPVVSKPEDE